MQIEVTIPTRLFGKVHFTIQMRLPLSRARRELWAGRERDVVLCAEQEELRPLVIEEGRLERERSPLAEAHLHRVGEDGRFARPPA